MSKLGLIGWAGIILMVAGYVLIPTWAQARMSRGLSDMNAAGGNANPAELAGAMAEATRYASYGPAVGMGGVVLVIQAFARRLPSVSRDNHP